MSSDRRAFLIIVAFALLMSMLMGLLIGSWGAHEYDSPTPTPVSRSVALDDLTL